MQGGFATWPASFDSCNTFVKQVNAAGGDAQMMSLPAMGIKGNSHMLMQDKNNLQLADLIVGWIDPFADAANASLLEYTLQDIQVFNGGHFNLVLPLTSVPSRTFARTFGGPPLVGSAIGAHNSAVYGNPAQGHYTMHSHEKTLKLYNFHFDKYDPTDILRFQWVPHLFGEVIGGHPTGSVCLDPAWASQ